MSNKYKREIEEILKQAGDLKSAGSGRKTGHSIWRLIWLNVRQSVGGKAWSLSPGRVMLIAISLLLSALIVRVVVPGLVGPLAWAGLLLFIVAYALFFIRPRKVDKRWRGQPLDESAANDSWWDRFRRKLK
jgi:hypothetical protein